MKQRKIIALILMAVVVLFSGCSEKLSETKETFEGQGVTYEMQLPSSWKVDSEDKSENYGLQTSFSAEDKKSNSYMFATVTPVNEVKQKGFAEQTREQLKERYGYKKAKDIYMKEYKINGSPVCKYTLNTVFKEKDVWAHMYYMWTENGFVQVTFYSADDSNYEKRSKLIDESVGTLKEVSFDTEKFNEAQKKQKEDEGDVVTLENKTMKVEMTGVRKVVGENKKNVLAIRYTFTNNSSEQASASVFKELITAKQKDKKLSEGTLPEDTSFLDLKELVNNQSKVIPQGQSIDSVIFYELADNSIVELSYSQEAFPGTEPTKAVVPE
ncbi:DUF5067 domain-containing protein [Candidatus Enterococcus mansonii]|uniref:DUF5067 domain-containing protein n=1 Tax=Candidatus Enterococcus mansonii TaxID=1834181 RepID=A0A242CC60_9ENTE|nr:DUF5067 domain-containing protein [Enterococcus sp. 4G2_DIV0659]OTO07844.1 hypothetical protein A5880_002114 [Enterococcus sp. 4G2_DIV0659]